MIVMRCVLSFLLLPVVIGSAGAQPDTKLDPALRGLVEALGSTDFKTREKAMRDLAKLDEVPDALREAAQSKDAEMRRRAEALVKIIADRLGDKAFLAGVNDSMVTDLHNPDMDRFIRYLMKSGKDGAKNLAKYGLDKKKTAKEERERWQADKEGYADAFPLRAAIFEASAEVAAIRAKKLPVVLDTAPTSSDILELQAPVGQSIFMLERLLARMKDAGALANKETSARWQADFDFTLTRVEAELIFQFEYSFVVGQIRIAGLPNLRPGETGWKITPVPQLTIFEQKPKTLAKERRKLLERIQEVHADTPWAYFAEREGRRDLGMRWVAKKQ
jgi:hypothetical protein